MAFDKNKERIDNLKQSLYSRKSAPVSGVRRTQITRGNQDVGEDWEREQPRRQSVIGNTKVPGKKKKKSKMRLFFIIALIFFLGASAFAFFRFFGGFGNVSAQNISIRIDSPVSINGGDNLDLEVFVTNKNDVAVESSTLTIEYPSGTRVVDDIQSELTRQRETMGTLKSGETIDSSFSSILFGKKDEQKEINVILEFRVDGSNATFTKEEKVFVTISSSPINVTVDGPSDVNSGQTVEYIVNLTSNSTSKINDLMFSVDYPFGFSFKEGNPNPDFNENVWRIGTLEPGEETQIVFRGVMEGQENEERTFKMHTGAASVEDPSKIAATFVSYDQGVVLHKPFIGLSLGLNGSAGGDYLMNIGNSIQADINWVNNLNTAVSEATIEVSLLGESIDETSVSVGSGGFYRSIDDTIVWDSRTLKDLETVKSGDSGSASFSFSTKQLSPILVNDLENPQIDIRVSMKGNRFNDSGQVTERINVEENRSVKISSDLRLSPRVVYTVGPFENSGPIPPEAEDSTTYTVIWSVTNTFNEVNDVVLTASLPSYVKWLGKIDPSNEDITYDENTRKLTWNIGRARPSTGYDRSPEEVAFQIEFNPSVGQIGSSPVLLTNIELMGTDAFTNETLMDTRNALDIRITTDPGVGTGDYRVK